MKHPPRHYAFGPYVIDGLRGLLWEHGSAVPLTPRVFELLVVLIEHRGEDLAKDDLINQVWGGTAVEENNLARHVSTLRKALHERPGQRDYIATIPGVGYRFVAEVTELDKLPPQLTHAPVRVSPHGGPAPAATHEGERAPVLLTPLIPAASAAAPVRPRRVKAAIVTTALVSATMVLGVMLYRALPPATVVSVQRALNEFTYGSGWQRDPAWSPDGRSLAYASDRSGNFDIWVQGLDDPTPLQVTTSPYQESQPSWSPDGQWLVFRSERDGGGLFVARARGGSERRIADFGSRPLWSPTGDRILFSSAPPDTAGALKMYVVGRNGGTPEPVAHSALTDFNPVSAAWHPDGRLSIWGRNHEQAWSFVTLSLTTGNAVYSRIPPAVRQALEKGNPSLTTFSWAPDGEHLYFEGRSQSIRNIWRVDIDPTSMVWARVPERLTNGPGSDTTPAVSPDGTCLAFGIASGRTAMWSFPFDSAAGRLTGPGRAETTGEAGERGADAWMDGRRLVYLASKNGRQEVWEQAQDEGPPRLLLSATDWTHTRPRWSPDGTQIAYARSRRLSNAAGTERAVAVLAVNTRNERIVPVSDAAEVIPSDWSADGHALLTACRLSPADRRVGTCLLSLEAGDSPSGSLKQLWTDDRASMFQQRWSPDQRWISFIAVRPSERSTAQVYVMPAAGGTWTPITDGAWYDDKPRWGADGRTLYFISNRGGRSDVWGRRIDPATGEPTSDLFKVTSFEQGRQIISPYLDQLEMNITRRRIFLPLHEATGQIWILDHVNR